MKAKDLKTILVPLKLCEKEFKIAFDFNAMCELDEVYGDFDEAMKAMRDGKGRLKAIRALIYSAIKPRYSQYSLVNIGEMLTEVMASEEKANYIMGQLEKAMNLALPPKEEEGE
jgi:hypothetical protein